MQKPLTEVSGFFALYADLCWCIENQGLEQHGRAAGGAANTPVGCLLVRGFQRSGMSTGDDAQKSSWSENGLMSLSPFSVVCSRSVAKFGENRQNGSENPIFADFWV